MKERENNIVDLPTLPTLEEEAAAWIAILDCEEVSSSVLESFRRWLQKSDRHQEAFDELSALWGELAVLKELDDIAESVIETTPPPGLWHRRDVLAAAASIGALAIGAGYYAGQTLGDSKLYSKRSRTAVGEQQTIRMPDGSTIYLNTDSEVDINFTGEARLVTLLRGEAYFDVAKDVSRRFSVNASGGIVEALGTAFSVRLRESHSIEVIVEEGLVSLVGKKTPSLEMRDEKNSNGERIVGQLSAGQSAMFAENLQKVSSIQPADMNRKLAWRQGLLAYSGESLEDVVADISRYTDLTIEFSDPAVKETAVGGYFKVGETAALFETLEFTFGLNVEYVSKNRVVISRTTGE